MAVVRRGKVEPKVKRKSHRYYAVVLEGDGNREEYSIIMQADCFDIQDDGAIAAFYIGGGNDDYDEESGRRVIAAIKGWRRVMEMTEERFREAVREMEQKDSDAEKKLSSVFVEPGKM